MKKYLTYIKENKQEKFISYNNFFKFIYSNNIKKIKEHIKQGFDINSKDIECERSAIVYATYYNKPDIIKLLLQYTELDINSQDHYGNTALLYASYYGHNEIFDFLIEHPNINVNIKNNYNNTALILATYNEKFETYNTPNHVIHDKPNNHVIKTLLQQPDIDIEIEDNDGITFIKRILYKKAFLIDYDLQKKILENGRKDIILYLNNYGLVDDKIKEENPDLFNANKWGLI
jgi:hypothetical protein